MRLTLGQLSKGALSERLSAGLRLRVGPFNVAIQAQDESLVEHIATCYPDYELAEPTAFAHAVVRIGARRRGLPPWSKRGIVWLGDGSMFTDFALGEGLPYLEWAINWCIATRCNAHLMLHAAVVEKRGIAMIMPGLPGAGKSTLSTYLAHNGWRLLSDEFCIFSPGTIDVLPFARLIPLKNESIDIIAEAVPGVRIGPRFEGTRKGTVAHVTPLSAHATNPKTARAGLIVKPQFAAGEVAALAKMPQAQCFVELSNNSFNYQILGREGFQTVTNLSRAAHGYQLRYGNLAEAANELDDLLERHFPLQASDLTSLPVDLPAAD